MPAVSDQVLRQHLFYAQCPRRISKHASFVHKYTWLSLFPIKIYRFDTRRENDKIDKNRKIQYSDVTFVGKSCLHKKSASRMLQSEYMQRVFAATNHSRTCICPSSLWFTIFFGWTRLQEQIAAVVWYNIIILSL